MKFIQVPTTDIYPNDEIYINFDNVDNVKIIHLKDTDNYQLWFFSNGDAFCYGTFDTAIDARIKLGELIVEAKKDF